MDFLINYFFLNWPGAITIILLGGWQLLDTINHTKFDPNSILQPKIKGFFLSIGLLLLGGIILYNKIIGNF
jgi:hypothetical protein